MSKRKCYDVAFKLQAVSCAEKNSKEATVREFGVDTKRIHVWCCQEDSLILLEDSGISKSKRLSAL